MSAEKNMKKFYKEKIEAIFQELEKIL